MAGTDPTYHYGHTSHNPKPRRASRATSICPCVKPIGIWKRPRGSNCRSRLPRYRTHHSEVADDDGAPAARLCEEQRSDNRDGRDARIGHFSRRSKKA